MATDFSLKNDVQVRKIILIILCVKHDLSDDLNLKVLKTKNLICI